LEVISSQNVSRCPRCKKALIQEQLATHKCSVEYRLRGYQEVFVDHVTDMGKNVDCDHVLSAWGLDGTLYKLVICKHRPPHSLKSRLVTAIKRPDNETEPPQKFYISGFLPAVTKLVLYDVGTRYSRSNLEGRNSAESG
jgi:hypothetical protein